MLAELAGLLMDELGCEVTVASARSNRPSTYPLPGGVRLLQARHAQEGLFAYFRFLLKLRRERFHYVVGFWAQDNILLLLAFLFSRTRVVLCEHQSHFFPPGHVRLARRWMYPLASRVTVLNDAELRHYSRFLGNVRLIPNPVMPAREPAQATRRDKLVIGIGHLIPRKGFHELVQAWARSGLDAEGWRLAILGYGPERVRLERAISDLALTNVQIVPPTSDIAAWYRRARIIVSTANVEVFSLVIAEAVNHGVVPLAYAADGPSFLLEDTPELLVPIGDIDGMAERLRSLANRPDLDSISARARESLERRMSRAQVGASWRRIIRPDEAKAE